MFAAEKEPVLPIEIRRQLAAGDSPRIFVRGEEIGIVMVVLGLWVSAMALFFHRWGKIRMLEPYQPAYHKESLPGSPTTSRIFPPMNPAVSMILHSYFDETEFILLSPLNISTSPILIVRSTTTLHLLPDPFLKSLQLNLIVIDEFSK